MGKAPDPLEKTAYLRKNVLSPPPSPGQRKKEERGSESLKERLPETVCSDPSDPSSARFSFPGEGKLFFRFGLFSQQRKARPRTRGMEGEETSARGKVKVQEEAILTRWYCFFPTPPAAALSMTRVPFRESTRSRK